MQGPTRQKIEREIHQIAAKAQVTPRQFPLNDTTKALRDFASGVEKILLALADEIDILRKELADKDRRQGLAVRAR